jgi:hypothetical protein
MKQPLIILALTATVSLCSNALAADSCFVHGDWESNWGNMTFYQHNNDVKGDYTYNNKAGKIKGVMRDGHTLVLDWSQEPDYKAPQNAGKAQFIFNEDCTSWSGKWSYGNEQPSQAGWDATRIIFTEVDNPDAESGHSSSPTPDNPDAP